MQPAPAINCEMTVAKAAPKTDIPRTFTNKISKTTLIRHETMRKYKGPLESPSALSINDE